MAAENAYMHPMMDPRFHGMWGVPGAVDEAQWQQFYQMMQQQHKQQQQHLLERSKQEFLLGKQGSQFPLSAYPFFYGDKHLDQQRKVINLIKLFFIFLISRKMKNSSQAHYLSALDSYGDE